MPMIYLDVIPTFGRLSWTVYPPILDGVRSRWGEMLSKGLADSLNIELLLCLFIFA